VLVPTPTGAQVPISLLADIKYKTGPPSVRSENGKLVGFVFVDVTTSNIDGYVRKASQHLSQHLQYPAGYYTEWAGQFQYLEAAKQRLKVVIPFTLLIIFVLLYISTRSVTKTAIVLLAVPFSLVGAFWLLWLLGYNMSVAVWVGLIALAALDARRRSWSGAAEDHDRVCHPFRLAADHVVARHASRRGCDETHRCADDRRRCHFRGPRVAHLPRDLCHLAATRTAGSDRRRSAFDSTSVDSRQT